MNALAYLRVSGLGQVQGDGFPRQKQAIEEYCAAHDLTVVAWYEEQGVSGKVDSDDRPALRRLFSELNGTRTVIVERLDRLARDLIVQEGIIGRFREAGVELISTAEPDLCSEDPTRVFIRQVLGAVAQLDRSLIVRKLRTARERIKAEKGKCEGRLAFGERSAAEKRTLDHMLYLQGDGLCSDEIAIVLNGVPELYPTRSGRPWRGSVVRKILARQSCASENRKTQNPLAPELSENVRQER